MTTIPLVTQPLDDINVTENAKNTSIDLFQNFDDPFTTGKVARFELENTSLGGGVTNVLLFDQSDEGAPETVANFTNYVEDGDYVNSIIHRSVPGFIIQGGGFTSNDLEIANVPADPAVVNEFSEDRSNLRGTIAMAKLGNDPNSATNQWFFNLANNSDNLDNQNGGFTVFGEVLSESDLAPVDAIADVSIFNGSNINSAFSDLPLILNDDTNPSIENDQNYIRYKNITISQTDELEFKVSNNSNPDLVDVFVSRGGLYIDYADDQNGTAEITIEATDLLGDSVEDTFTITVEEDNSVPPSGGGGNGVPVENSNRDSTVYRFLNQDTGVHLYTTSKVERDNILETLPNYEFESFSYVSVDSLTGNPEPKEVYRLLNQDTGTHLYTISENEKNSVENTLDNFSLESESFFAYTEQQTGTVPVYRFYNNETGAHFYTPSEVEKSVIDETLPNYTSEGIAYYVFPVD